VGFLEGSLVVPVVDAAGHGESDDDDDDGVDAEQQAGASPATIPKTAWDEPGDVPPAVENEVDTTDEAVGVVTSDEQENDDAPAPQEKGETQEKEEDASASAIVMTPEDILHHAVCQGLVSLQKKDLPMPLAQFYSQYVLPNRPKGTTVELKATRYKKFGNYVKEQSDSGLLQAGPDKSNPKNTDPLALLMGVRKNHEDLKGFSKADSVSTSTSANNNNSDNKTKLVLVNLYVIPSHWPNLLRLDRDDVDASNASSEDRKGTGMLTAPEVRNIIEAYLVREELIPANRPDMVTLDGPLTAILYKKTDAANTPTQLSRKDLNKLLMSKLNAAYALVEMPGSKITVLKRGTPPKVEIEVAMRQSKKFVTRVRGLEDYGIEPTYFSKDVAKRLACAATIEDDPVGRAALKKGRVEVVFQGNVVDELEALLTGDETMLHHGGVKDSEYAIPAKVLDITLRKGVPARKRGSGGGGKKRK